MRCTGEAVRVGDGLLSTRYAAGADLRVGKPFVTLRVGQVSARSSGQAVGPAVTLAHLEDMARLIRERMTEDPVVVDWQHMSEPDAGATPEAGAALGQIVDAWVDGDGLVVVPALTRRGVRLVEESEGVLWSSPSFFVGDVHARDDSGAVMASAQMLAVTLTPRPAQQADRISAVTLAEAGNDTEESMADAAEQQDGLSPDEMSAMIDTLREALAAAEARIAELEGESETSEAGDAALTESAAQVARLTEQVAALGVKLTDERDARLASERERDIAALIADGVAPANRAALTEAWAGRDSNPAVWAALTERSVPLGRAGSAKASMGAGQTAQARRAKLTEDYRACEGSKAKQDYLRNLLSEGDELGYRYLVTGEES